MTPYLQLAGQLAWPITALIIMIVLLKEIKSGIVTKIIPPGGSFRYGDFTISREIQQAQQAIASTDVELETPDYAQPTHDEYDDEQLTPYEIVMKSYSGMSTALAELASQHDGWNDQRYVRDNIELLLKKRVIDGGLFGAIRSSQQARNSIRRLGESAVTEEQARAYAETAYSAERALREKIVPA
ncbi:MULTISPECIES: hypothetical protein [unclassified Sphingomonas]|uniref:hypothetical protein n=1 Tax=unclassified Sphingomonas TaxID=196159 RepID=UPI0025EA7945|nr:MULTISPECIES: hypothetical protein [unclassified Sphingomonas]